MVMKSSTIFCDITPCSPLKVNRRFGGTCRLHLQRRRISQARNQRDGGSTQRPAVLASWLILRLWRWRPHVPPKRRLTFNRLHGVISENIEHFKWVISHLDLCISVRKNSAFDVVLGWVNVNPQVHQRIDFVRIAAWWFVPKKKKAETKGGEVLGLNCDCSDYVVGKCDACTDFLRSW
jgi:hypothetical protein